MLGFQAIFGAPYRKETLKGDSFPWESNFTPLPSGLLSHSGLRGLATGMSPEDSALASLQLRHQSSLVVGEPRKE